MTCKNCIHLPVCALRIHWGVGSDWNNRYTPDVEKRCKEFINKADSEKKDVVEVVRCKDCQYYEIHKPSVTLNCERDGKLIPMMPNDFCNYGRRKEGTEG